MFINMFISLRLTDINAIWRAKAEVCHLKSSYLCLLSLSEQNQMTKDVNNAKQCIIYNKKRTTTQQLHPCR